MGRSTVKKKTSRSSTRSTKSPFGKEARSVLSDAARSMRALEKSAASDVAAAATLVVACFESGGTVYFCGNGGSAADAQHFACELSGRFLLDRPALPAVALSTNTSALTAIGNENDADNCGYKQGTSDLAWANRSKDVAGVGNETIAWDGFRCRPSTDEPEVDDVAKDARDIRKDRATDAVSVR